MFSSVIASPPPTPRTQPTHFNISFATHVRINEIKRNGEWGNGGMEEWGNENGERGTGNL